METRLTYSCGIEALEQRIAPATLVFIDAVDGDEVTITISKGTDADLAAVAIFAGTPGAQTLQVLRLADNPVFRGADVTITATSASGASTIDIGHIDATGLDLGVVKISGDLGQIDAGDKRTSTVAIKTLEVTSIGQRGLETQGANGDLESRIFGRVNTITIAEDFAGTFRVFGGKGGVDGRIGTLTIGGSLEGGSEENSGSLIASGSIGAIAVSGSLLGGAGKGSASILAGSTISEVSVGGDLIGHASQTAQIRAGVSIASVEIDGSLIGGGGERSGSILAAKTLSSVKVHGGLTGGSGSESGVIGSRVLKEVTVDSETPGGIAIQGGGGGRSGAILGSVSIVKVTINGSIQGGGGVLSGTIASEGTIGEIVVHGNILGGGGDESGSIGSKKAAGDVSVFGNVKGGVGDQSGRIVSATSLRTVLIGGAIEGGSGDESGAVGATGVVGSVIVNGNLIGGSGSRSGYIASGKELPAVQIDGNLWAGEGFRSGAIFSGGNIGTVQIANDMGVPEIGEQGPSSAQIVAELNIRKVSIGGSLYGGVSDQSGLVNAGRTLERVEIAGNVFAGDGFYSGSVAAGTIKSAFVGGNVNGGAGAFSASFVAVSGDIQELEIVGELSTGIPPVLGEGEIVLLAGPENRTASIAASRYLGEISIGEVSGNFLKRVQITAGGVVGATGERAMAIRSLVIAGNISAADILAGYNLNGEGVNPDVRIGKVVVGTGEGGQRESGFLSGTNIIAGVLRGEDGIFGTRDDEMITARGASKRTISTIDEIDIQTSTFGFETGFVAEHIKSIVLSGVPEALLNSGARNDFFTFDIHSGSGTTVSELPPNSGD